MLFELILSLLLLLAVLLCLFSYDNNNCLIVIKNALALSFVVNIGKTRVLSYYRLTTIHPRC
jgi:hypothetical protein